MMRNQSIVRPLTCRGRRRGPPRQTASARCSSVSAGCDAADAVVAYARDWPHSVPLRISRGDIADGVHRDGYNRPRTWFFGLAVSDAELFSGGIALVSSGDVIWVRSVAARDARNPASRRIDVDIARDDLGIPGRPQRYVIFIVPLEPRVEEWLCLMRR